MNTCQLELKKVSKDFNRQLQRNDVGGFRNKINSKSTQLWFFLCEELNISQNDQSRNVLKLLVSTNPVGLKHAAKVT
jgi:hypothetical protein